MLVLAYFVVLGFQIGFFASFLQGLTAGDGFSVAWQIFAVAIVVLSVGLTAAGVRPSLQAGLIALCIEVVILMALGILIVVKGGASGNTLQAFNPSRSLQGQHGLWIGVVYTIFAFAGFESSATLGEELKNPRRNVARAVVGTVLFLGIFETFMAYSAVIGYGTSKADILSLTSAGTPITTLANQYGNSTLSFFVTLAIVSSFTALNIVTISALSRMGYAMSRDHLLPTWLGRLNRRNAPGVAAAAIGGSALLLVLICGSISGPVIFASWVAYFGTLFFILAYMSVVIGIVWFIRKKHAAEWSWTKHGLLPAVAFGGLVWVAYGNVHPLPPSPLDYFVWVTIAVAVGLGALAYWLSRNRPDIVDKAGYVFEENPEVEEPSLGWQPAQS